MNVHAYTPLRGGASLRRLKNLVVVASSVFLGCAGTSAPRAAPASMPVPSGGPHDFDFFEGAWTSDQHRLKARGVGAHEWDNFPGNLCMTLHLGGLVTADEVAFPTKGWSGFTLRAFDVQKKTWLIYWISSRTGVLQAPVAGGFSGDRGEFYGDDDDDGRPIRARYLWTKQDHDRARWEQAFSYDGGKSWETNWTADFTRADAKASCVQGKPR